MDIDEMKKSIRDYLVAEYLDEDEAATLTGDSALVSSGLIDSISVLQVVDFLEQTFKFEFEPHEVDHENLNTINLMVEFVKSKKS